MKTLLLAFGNEYVEQDNLAIEISKELKLDNIEVKRCYSVDELYDYQDYERIFILDVVKDIEKTMLITDIDRIKGHKLYSLHDFDLGFFLKLMSSLGMLKEIKIIGIPQKGNKEAIKEDIIKLSSLL